MAQRSEAHACDGPYAVVTASDSPPRDGPHAVVTASLAMCIAIKSEAKDEARKSKKGKTKRSKLCGKNWRLSNVQVFRMLVYLEMQRRIEELHKEFDDYVDSVLLAPERELEAKQTEVSLSHESSDDRAKTPEPPRDVPRYVPSPQRDYFSWKSMAQCRGHGRSTDAGKSSQPECCQVQQEQTTSCRHLLRKPQPLRKTQPLRKPQPRQRCSTTAVRRMSSLKPASTTTTVRRKTSAMTTYIASEPRSRLQPEKSSFSLSGVVSSRPVDCVPARSIAGWCVRHRQQGLGLGRSISCSRTVEASQKPRSRQARL